MEREKQRKKQRKTKHGKIYQEKKKKKTVFLK